MSQPYLSLGVRLFPILALALLIGCSSAPSGGGGGGGSVGVDDGGGDDMGNGGADDMGGDGAGGDDAGGDDGGSDAGEDDGDADGDGADDGDSDDDDGDSDGSDGPPTGELLTLDLGGGVTMELVRIPAGSFMMGSEAGRTEERPIHPVTLTKDFYIGRYKVTQSQWQAVTGDNPARFNECGDCPVENVIWDEAVAFCDTLSDMTGFDIRLPTEAEREYACRAETTTEYSFGDDEGQLGDHAWTFENSDSQTHPVGEKLPNPWGLYDMHGHLWEWCSDWYSSAYYSLSPTSDPTGPDTGEDRVLRGGSWLLTINGGFFRSAFRSFAKPDFRSDVVGLRVAAGT